MPLNPQAMLAEGIRWLNGMKNAAGVGGIADGNGPFAASKDDGEEDGEDEDEEDEDKEDEDEEGDEEDEEEDEEEDKEEEGAEEEAEEEAEEAADEEAEEEAGEEAEEERRGSGDARMPTATHGASADESDAESDPGCSKLKKLLILAEKECNGEDNAKRIEFNATDQTDMGEAAGEANEGAAEVSTPAIVHHMLLAVAACHRCVPQLRATVLCHQPSRFSAIGTGTRG